MDKELFQVPGEVSKVTSMMNRSVRLYLDTQENLDSESMSKLMSMVSRMGWFTFSMEKIKPEDLLSLPEIKLERNEKTSSVRLRSVLFILWKQREKTTETFDEFYKAKMEKIIDRVKETLV